MKIEQLKELFLQMTPVEKLGQLTQVTAEHFVEGMDEELVETGPGFDELERQEESLSAAGSVLGVSSAAAVNAVQRNFLKRNRLKIPLMFMHDAIHGYRTIFPIPLALSCSFDEELVRRVARCTARELRASGIHVDFSPMTDLVRDARWGRVMESFGEDHILSGNLGRAMVEGYQNSADGTLGEEGAAACVKHFAAYGAACAGKDYASVDMSMREFFGCYARPYETALKAKPRFVMSSFNSLNGEPVTASRYLLEGVLRGRFGFEGIVISDWGAVAELKNHGTASCDREAAREALEAGVEIEMTSSCYLRYGEELISQEEALARKVDEAVWKVLCLKNELGLFENPYVDEEREAEILFSKEMRDTAEEAALESCVLLKNNDSILPMGETYRRIVILGPFAGTKELLGNWACKGRFEDVVSLEEGMKQIFAASSIEAFQSLKDCPGEAFEAADFVVVTVGESWKYSGEGHSSANLELAEEQRRLIEFVHGSGKKYAAVAFSGRPLALESVIDKIPALLWCWYPGTQAGLAVAKLLAGMHSPSGRLTMSMPRVTGQAPVYYNEYRSGRPANETSYSSRYQDCGIGPLYSFGHGLGYADIRYENVSISSETIREGETVLVSADVFNNSRYSLKETVLLFMEDPVSGLVRPVKELLKYQRISLTPGEKKTVVFEIVSEELKYLDHQLHKKLEPGKINLYLNEETKAICELVYI